MMLKFREDKIHRMESLLDGHLPPDSYLLEENNAQSEEIQLLQARIDKNPEVTRFALENIRLSDQLRRLICRNYWFVFVLFKLPTISEPALCFTGFRTSTKRERENCY